MLTNDDKSTKISEKDMRADLERKFADVDIKNKVLDSRKIGMDNTLNNKREAIIRNLMEMIQQLGVDPTDEGAIEELEEQLRFQNPDLAELFRTALERLLEEKQLGYSEEDGLGEEMGSDAGHVPMPGVGAASPMMQGEENAGIPVQEAAAMTSKFQQMFGGQQ